MDIDKADVETKLAFLRSDLFENKMSRMMMGPPFNNDEFILTIGQDTFQFVLDVSSDEDNIREYSSEDRAKHLDKLKELGFAEVGRINFTIDLEKIKQFYRDTDPNKRTRDWIGEYIQGSNTYSNI